MTLDRSGDPVLDHDCRRGWLGEDDEGRPIPCLVCRPHLSRPANVQPEPNLSARAQWAIDQESRR